MIEVGLHVIAAGDATGRAEVDEFVVGACNRCVGKAGAEQTSYKIRERADSGHLIAKKDIH